MGEGPPYKANSKFAPENRPSPKPAFFRGYVNIRECTIGTNSHANKLWEFKLKLQFSTIYILGKIPISDSIDLIVPATACNFAGEPNRMKALWAVTLSGRTSKIPLEPRIHTFRKDFLLGRFWLGVIAKFLIDAAGAG